MTTHTPESHSSFESLPPQAHRAKRVSAVTRGVTRLKEAGLWRAETFIIAGAVVVGIFGAVLQHANQNAFEKRLQNEYQITPVVVASMRLAQGTLLQREHLTTGNMLSGSRTPNMLALDELPKLIGKPIQVSLGKGDPLLMSNVSSELSDGSVAARIPQGKRLFSLKVDDAVAQSGFVRPGDFVDIISTMDLPGRGSTTFTMVSRVQLTAVGKSMDATRQIESTQVSFFVSPQQMELLKHAEAHGSFSLSLRNPNDKTVAQTTRGINLKDVFLSDSVYAKAEIPVEINDGKAKPK